jgi:hypothetical protein
VEDFILRLCKPFQALRSCLILGFGILSCALLLSGVTAHAADYSVNLVEPSGVKIEGLRWAQSVQILPDLGSKGFPSARVQGDLIRKDWSLISGQTALITSAGKNRHFDLVVSLTRATTPFEVTAIGPRGQPQKEILSITVTNWPALLASLQTRKNRFSAGVSYTSISLTQTGVPNFSENGVTVKGNYAYVLSRSWSLSGNAFFTAVPFGSNIPGFNARFLGINARIGYRLPFSNHAWDFSLFGGVYYTTMFVTNNAFGYENELGPQFYPSIRRIFMRGESLSLYLKYSPVTTARFRAME